MARLDATESRGGIGLIGMRERALQLAGMVSVDSTPGEGTVLRIILPATLSPGTDRNAPRFGLTAAHGLEPS